MYSKRLFFKSLVSFYMSSVSQQFLASQRTKLGLDVTSGKNQLIRV